VNLWSRVLLAWAWAKKNWKWLLAPLGAVLWLLGRGSKKTVIEVQSPELTGFEEEAKKMEAAAEGQRQAAKTALDSRIIEIQQKNAVAIQELSDASAKQAAELQANPDGVNAFLKGVSKDVRKV
jgi:hypothetical protein